MKYLPHLWMLLVTQKWKAFCSGLWRINAPFRDRIMFLGVNQIQCCCIIWPELDIHPIYSLVFTATRTRSRKTWFPNVCPTIYLPKWKVWIWLQAYKAARYPTKPGVINDVKLFPTLYRSIYCLKFWRYLINQTSRYKSKCIRIISELRHFCVTLNIFTLSVTIINC